MGLAGSSTAVHTASVRWLLALLTAAAVLPLSAGAASVDPKALVLPQADMPARYLLDPGNSMAISRAFVLSAKNDGARDLLRAGFVGGYFARYQSSDPPRWRSITAGAYVFRGSAGARKALPSMVAGTNRGLGRARRVTLGDEGWVLSSGTGETGTYVVWRHGRVLSFVICLQTTQHRTVALAHARKQERLIAAKLG